MKVKRKGAQAMVDKDNVTLDEMNVDPNEALIGFLKSCRDGDRDGAAAHASGLCDWIAMGGILPDVSDTPATLTLGWFFVGPDRKNA